jgi:hypothetical protein
MFRLAVVGAPYGKLQIVIQTDTLEVGQTQ